MIKEVTSQACLVYRQLRNAKSWTDVSTLSESTNLVPRTIRGILTKLTESGLVETYKVHGGYRYRIKTVLTPEAKELALRIHNAEKIFGLTEVT